MYPASRIYNNVDSNGNVIQTLGELLSFAKMEYQIPVATFANITTTYPSPSIGLAIQVESTGKFYRWNGTEWKYFQILNSTQIAQILTDIGNKSNLLTTDKTNLVGAINETSIKIGNLTSLTTTNKTNLVGAVNETTVQLADIAYLSTRFEQAGDIDDTESINRALAFVNALGGGKVRIPFRTEQYVISNTLLIYSNTTLEVDTYATIFLANNSNCRMLENANKTTQTTLTRIDKNIKVTGGIWLGNGVNQIKTLADGGTCTGFLFSGVENLVFLPTKIENTNTYACWFCNVKNLLIENIEVYIDTITSNQDGIHIQGPSENITIRDCILKAHDNVIALNADDVAQGTYSTVGDITDVFIDNIHFNNTKQGMLLLSGTSLLDKVRIQNITGSAEYLVMIKCWNLGDGNYGDIAFENINIDWDNAGQIYREYFVFIEGIIKNLKFKNIRIPKGNGDGYRHAFRIRSVTTTETTINRFEIDGFESNTVTGEGLTLAPLFVSIYPTVTIKDLKLNNFVSKNSISTDGITPLQVIDATVDNIHLTNFDITNSKNSILNAAGATIKNIYLDKILMDSVSNPIVGINVSTNIDKINIVKSGKVLFPPYSIINNGMIISNLTNKVLSIETDYKSKLSGIPIDGYWNKNYIVYNTLPAPSGYLGWVCTTTGWAYKSSWAQTTAYTQGDFIKAGGAVFFCKVAGTSGTIMPSTWSGDSTDGTVTWTFSGAAVSVFKGFGLIQA